MYLYMPKWWFLLLLFFLSQAELRAQEIPSKKLKTSFLLGYQVGGQGENRNFVTKNGPGLQLSLQYQLNARLSTGVGLGYVQLEEERFIPIFAVLQAKFRAEANSPYVKFRIGGAPAFNASIEQLESYDFDGGLYFTAGWGYQFGLGQKLALFFEINLAFQEADLEFQSFAGDRFDEDFQFYFLVFNTGIKF